MKMNTEKQIPPPADISDFLDGAAHIHIGNGVLRVSDASEPHQMFGYSEDPHDGLIFSNYTQNGMPDHFDTFVERNGRDDKKVVLQYLNSKSIKENYCFDDCD
jgi:hypothetical protein